MEVNTGKMGTKERCVASQASAVLYCFA
jgi:hypothetical protein